MYTAACKNSDSLSLVGRQGFCLKSIICPGVGKGTRHLNKLLLPPNTATDETGCIWKEMVTVYAYSHTNHYLTSVQFLWFQMEGLSGQMVFEQIRAEAAYVIACNTSTVTHCMLPAIENLCAFLSFTQKSYSKYWQWL